MDINEVKQQFFENYGCSFVRPKTLELEKLANSYQGLAAYSEEQNSNGVVIFFWKNLATGQRTDINTFFYSVDVNEYDFYSKVEAEEYELEPIFLIGKTENIIETINDMNTTIEKPESRHLYLVN